MLELIGDERLAIEQPDINRNNLAYRRKRVKRLKMFIIALLIIILLLPTILCVFLFAKMNSMEEQIQVLKVMHEAEYKEYMGDVKIDDSLKVAHAAEKDKNVETEISETNEIQEESSAQTEGETAKEKKVVYLTFDDGPSEYTDKILDILDKYQVKASFFVVGKTDENSREMYQRIVNEGHTLGMHSYSHQYKSIYNSEKSFEKDFYMLQDYLYEITGVMTDIYRFPGGSSNQVSTGDMTEFIKFLNERDISYYDWNVTNGDATGEILTAKELADNAINGVKMHSVSMVLMHDSSTKINTVKSLPILIRELKAKGYEILPIQTDTVPIQHVESESIQ